MSADRKVCIITSVHPPFDVRIFHREAISLERNQFHVTLIAPSDQKEAEKEGIRILGIPTSKSRPVRYLESLKFFLAALGTNADIYHFHDPELIAVGALLQVMTRKPVIYDVHEHYPDGIMIREWLPQPTRRLISRVFDFCEKRMAPCFRALIVSDDALAERFRPIHKAVVTLHNFPRADFADGKTVPRATGFGSRVRLAYVGVISAERGLWLMLDLVTILVTVKGIDVSLRLAGEFSNERDQKLFEERIHRDSFLRGRVKWHGVIPHSQLAEWLRRTNIGLVPFQPIPKFFKNVPTKIFEYMAAGLPIVASDLPPIRGYLRSAKAGLLAIAADPNSHAEKIFYLIQNQQRAVEMARNGRLAFEDKYNWNAEEVKLVNLYNALLERRD